MTNTTRTTRLFALLLSTLLALSACSSGSDGVAEGTTDGAEEASAPDETAPEDDADGSGDAAIGCEEADEAGSVLRGANGWLPQVVDAETNDLVGASDDGDSVLAAIETLRPVQDIDGPLGTMREGLDNIEADIIAVREGRYDDKVGSYGLAAISGVILNELCF